MWYPNIIYTNVLHIRLKPLTDNGEIDCVAKQYIDIINQNSLFTILFNTCRGDVQHKAFSKITSSLHALEFY